MAFMQGYPKAHQNRIHGSDKSIRKTRVNLLKAAGLNFILLQILFLGLFCYIFGAIWQQSSHIHNMNVLFVDYDGSVLGTAVRDAYKTLQGKTFPTLQEMPSERFPTLGDVKEAVCRTNYWGAIYTSMGASERLANALPGGVAADTYNRSDVLTFVWNEARYSTIVDPDIQGTLITLSSTARVAYSAINGTGALQILNKRQPSRDLARISFDLQYSRHHLDPHPGVLLPRNDQRSLRCLQDLRQALPSPHHRISKLHIPSIHILRLALRHWCYLGIPWRLGRQFKPIRLDLGCALAVRTRELPLARRIYHLDPTPVCAYASDHMDCVQCFFDLGPIRTLPRVLSLVVCNAST
jgi:hypothetical protein